MTEDRKRTVDVWIAALGWVATVLTIFIGIYQFNKGEENKVRLENELLLRKDEIAFHRQLWLEGLTAYRKMAEVTGSIAADSNDQKKLRDDISQFNTLFWGTMIFVEDKDVDSFSFAIRDYQDGWIGVENLAANLPQKGRRALDLKERRHGSLPWTIADYLKVGPMRSKSFLPF